MPGLGELQRPPSAGPSRQSLPGLEAADRHLQPVGSPTGGAGNHLTRSESGQHLRPNTLKPAEQAMSRLEAGLDRQELLLQRPASVWSNLGASLPSCLAVGLDDLVGGGRVAREVLCARKKEKEEKTPNQKMSQKRQTARKDEEVGGLPSTRFSI